MPGQDDALDNSRREFVRVSLLVGLGAACAAAGVAPLLSSSPANTPLTIPVAPIESLVEGAGEFEALAKVGATLALDITLVRRDAGRNVRRAQTVFLSRVKEGASADCFLALSPICPHAGCTIERKEGGYACPCHAAKFGQDGKRLDGPSPRDLDPLPLSVANHEGKPWLHLTWHDFVIGIEHRVARS